MSRKAKLIAAEVQAEALRPTLCREAAEAQRSLIRRLDDLELRAANLREEIAELQRIHREIDAVNRGDIPNLKIA